MKKSIFLVILFHFFTMLTAFPQGGPDEKIYLQTDRPYYAAGETIFFKGYILTALDTIESSVLFVELWDNQFSKLAAVSLPLTGGTAAGSISMPKNIQTARVFLRAYTDESGTQQIPDQWVKPVLYEAPSDLAINAAQSREGQPVFYPEGGSLIYQALNHVAFRAPDHFQGTIRNNKGEQIAAIRPDVNGLGFFSFTPVKGESYSCYWKENGKESERPLPLPVETGVAIHVTQTADSIFFDLDNGGTRDLRVLKPRVQLIIGNEMAYVVELNMTLKARFSYFIPLHEFRTGIAELRVLDENDTVLARRPVFISRHSFDTGTRLEVTNKDLGKRGENRIRIQCADSTLRYVSVSITDADYSAGANGYKFMETALQQAGTPVSAGNPLAADLYLLTAEPVNKSIYNGKEYIKNRTTGGLQLSGTVKKGKKILAGKNIIVGLRSAYTGKEVYMVTTDDQGRFVLDNLAVFGETLVHCRLPGNSEEELISTFTVQHPAENKDSAFFQAFKNTAALLPYSGLQPVVPGLPTDDPLVFAEKIVTLEEVVLNTDPRQVSRKRVEELEKKYAEGTIFGGYDASGESLDVLNDPRAGKAIDLFTYIGTNMRSLRLGYSNGGKHLFYNGYSGNIPISIYYLDNARVERDIVEWITPDQIAYIKFVPRLGGEKGLPPAIAIFRKKPGEQGYWEKDRYQFLEQKIEGYPEAKEFTEPDYSKEGTKIEKDNRKTIVWRPYVPMEKGVAEIRFYNNDRTRKFRIVVEGIAADGSIIYFESMIE